MLKCPKCGNTDKFYVSARANVEINGDGYVEDHDGFEWERDAPCVCSDCFYEGEYKDFIDLKPNDFNEVEHGN